MTMGHAFARWPLAAALAATLSLALLAPVQARDLSIAAFYGNWRGSALSETELSVYFRLTARDLDVTIRPAPGGFTIAWTTVLRQKGDPGNPDIQRKSAMLAFVSAGRPSLWRATTSGDPIAGQALTWARIKGQTLTVTSMAITDDGGFEMQIYRRTLSARGMELEFTRLRDGEPVRTARGRLVKHAN